MSRIQLLIFGMLSAYMCASSSRAIADETMSSEQLEVAHFWEDMGTTLREKGFEAYAKRYHEDFTHWSMDSGGNPGTKTSAVRFWGKFQTDGHRITCTYVEPVTIKMAGDLAFARLIYEQTNEYSDGRVEVGVWRMASLFTRESGAWQILANNMKQVELNEYRAGLQKREKMGRCVSLEKAAPGQ